MQIGDYPIELFKGENYKGKVLLERDYLFEVHGPFGTGYNIRIVKKRHNFPINFLKFITKATLTFARDCTNSGVRTNEGVYGMSYSKIYVDVNCILEIDSNGNFEPINDSYAMALFIVNHHFSNKSDGIFKRRNA
jgi:hypothetical protein